MKARPTNPAASIRPQWGVRVFPALFGLLLGIALLKFGNPPIMEKWVTPPANGYELVLGFPWPIHWAYWMLLAVVVAGVFALVRGRQSDTRTEPFSDAPESVPASPASGSDHPASGRRQPEGWTPNKAAARQLPRPRWLMVLPIIWLVWQFLAASDSLDLQLSRSTVRHFAACVVCFYLGLLALSKSERLWPFWAGLLGGFIIVIASGWEQRFGGLEQTRRYFYQYVYPTLQEVSPEYLKKISSDRIFATLFYPNTLAGAILLLLPPLSVFIWGFGAYGRMTLPARSALTGLFAGAALACLFWSGSKGGWLLMLLLGLIVLLRIPFKRAWKVALVVCVIAAGLTAFTWKFSNYFKKGATSVAARFDYWRAATLTAKDHPWLGSGPGTFAIPYQRLKRPESEMARLVHNDYLEQASDSGLPGAALYALFTWSSLALIGRRLLGNSSVSRLAERDEDSRDPLERLRLRHLQLIAIWLGLLAWALHSTFDFGLYVPALAWSAFALLGFLLGRINPVDKPLSSR